MKPILFLLTISFFSANAVFACTCSLGGIGNETKVKFDQATIVLIGTVIEINEKTLRIKTEKFYKGEPRDEIRLERSPCSCTCDVKFRLNDKFLVFAIPSKKDEQALFVTDVCAGTARADAGKKEIGYLDNLSRERAQPGMIDPALDNGKKRPSKSKIRKIAKPL